MKIDLSNFSGWVIYEKGTIVATYDKENFHRYYDQEEIRILQQENKQLKEKLENDIDRYEDTISYQLGFDKGKEYLQQRIDKAIELTKNVLKTEDRGYYQIIFKEILKSLGDEDNEN